MCSAQCNKVVTTAAEDPAETSRQDGGPFALGKSEATLRDPVNDKNTIYCKMEFYLIWTFGIGLPADERTSR